MNVSVANCRACITGFFCPAFFLSTLDLTLSFYWIYISFFFLASTLVVLFCSLFWSLLTVFIFIRLDSLLLLWIVLDLYGQITNTRIRIQRTEFDRLYGMFCVKVMVQKKKSQKQNSYFGLPNCTLERLLNSIKMKILFTASIFVRYT